jgi:hypothetical protein
MMTSRRVHIQEGDEVTLVYEGQEVAQLYIEPLSDDKPALVFSPIMWCRRFLDHHGRIIFVANLNKLRPVTLSSNENKRFLEDEAAPPTGVAL